MSSAPGAEGFNSATVLPKPLLPEVANSTIFFPGSAEDALRWGDITVITLDHLSVMVQGIAYFDKLFLSGLLKVEGNPVKGAQIRQLLCEK